MNARKRAWVGIFGLALTLQASAAIVDTVEISGTVQNISKTAVELKTELGTVIKIPRSAFNEKTQAIRPGKSTTLRVSLKQIVSYNRSSSASRR